MPLYTFSLMQSFHSIQKRLGQMYSHLHSKGLSPSYEFKVLLATMLMYYFLIDVAIRQCTKEAGSTIPLSPFKEIINICSRLTNYLREPISHFPTWWEACQMLVWKIHRTSCGTHTHKVFAVGDKKQVQYTLVPYIRKVQLIAYVFPTQLTD